MRAPSELLRSPPLPIKIAIAAFLSVSLFFFGKHFSRQNQPQLLFFPNATTTTTSSSIAISPNANSNQTLTLSLTPPPPAPLPPSPPPPSLPPPPPPPERFGIVDETGAMADDFEVGDFDPDMVEDWDPAKEALEEETAPASRVRVRKYRICDAKLREYIPCLDNEEEIKKLSSTERGELFERRCPRDGKGLDCLVPVPKGYKPPIPWPRSRDEVWYTNVPHTRLVDDKGGQNWILRAKDKFRFPGGGTQFIHGANQYLDHISQMVPDISFGHHTRVVLDVGCGVASFGAFLLSRNVITLSIAPKDVHENQIQFALERGVPAMVAAFAKHRLLYPSQAFDLIHCSRCRINWTRDDGILLLEVNRMLRGGGYFAWAAQPVYKHEESQQEAWKDMEDLTNRICWELVKKEGYIAIWRKPLNNTCYVNRDTGTKPPLCDVDDDPNKVWYVDLKACISRIPENGYGTNISAWPSRVHEPPQRLQSVEMDAYMAKDELFKAESRFWSDIVGSYVRVFHWKKMKLRNVMDMRAGFGGFAAALIEHKIDSWVLNVVPISGFNTLPVIYDRGLIGVSHDWCEPFDTYPRTYDLLHASDLFSREQKRCKISNILLEMDRILRPGGRAYIRDNIYIIDEIQEITKAMGWRTDLRDTSEGPYANRKILMCQKKMLRK
ncbi:putative methyltransferase PMT11 isoform X1 [Iris pallida]|uniref:Methyltransferase n=1 Tax=Iris pallida TaxID=29817 RepID=A0AAX6FF40_IRIPA|nr:putative methyltransferase PMT11 isoform X1 [Iris pallida]